MRSKFDSIRSFSAAGGRLLLILIGSYLLVGCSDLSPIASPMGNGEFCLRENFEGQPIWRISGEGKVRDRRLTIHGPMAESTVAPEIIGLSKSAAVVLDWKANVVESYRGAGSGFEIEQKGLAGQRSIRVLFGIVEGTTAGRLVLIVRSSKNDGQIETSIEDFPLHLADFRLRAVLASGMLRFLAECMDNSCAPLKSEVPIPGLEVQEIGKAGFIALAHDPDDEIWIDDLSITAFADRVSSISSQGYGGSLPPLWREANSIGSLTDENWRFDGPCVVEGRRVVLRETGSECRVSQMIEPGRIRGILWTSAFVPSSSGAFSGVFARWTERGQINEVQYLIGTGEGHYPNRPINRVIYLENGRLKKTFEKAWHPFSGTEDRERRFRAYAWITGANPDLEFQAWFLRPLSVEENSFIITFINQDFLSFRVDLIHELGVLLTTTDVPVWAAILPPES